MMAQPKHSLGWSAVRTYGRYLERALLGRAGLWNPDASRRLAAIAFTLQFRPQPDQFGFGVGV
jgi:hypothetical protein